MDKTESEVLLVHLGGLGDVCLSESVLLSLQKHFGNHLVGLGNKRFLNLFNEYFLRVEGVESRKWLYLFSERLTGMRWKQIVFIGKDRERRLRNRWQKYSEEEVMFIDMYPEDAFSASPPASAGTAGVNREKVHIEDYQLAQLSPYGVQPLKKVVLQKKGRRVILYPEKGFKKEKWHHENFVALYHSLEENGVDAMFLESLGLPLDVRNKVFFADLEEVKMFLDAGGIFVSNDCGMAHLAGASGLVTVTIFTNCEPDVWHPRGANEILRHGKELLDVKMVESVVLEIKRGDVSISPFA